jgi:hypothetical protein
MAIGVYYSPQTMSEDRYMEVHRRLEQAGYGTPAGRTYHCGMQVGPNIHVFDVWDSQESLDTFGEVLVPILQEVGIDAGEPHISEIVYEVRG